MSKKLIKSLWMPISTKPAYEGWYEFIGYLYEAGVRLYWNGSQWGRWLDKERTIWIHFCELRADKWRGKIDR